jgi:hypothetical protein
MRDDDRYTRQRRLAEIGDSGQERLSGASVTLGGGAEAVVTLVYLHRAGVGSVAIDRLSEASGFVHAAAFRHEAARRYAGAAWRALRTIVEIVGAEAPRDASQGAPS